MESLKSNLPFEEDSNKEDRDLYQYARSLQMAVLKGKEIDISNTDKQKILDELELVRRGENQRPLEQGYEIARWIMIARILFPNEKLEALESDIVKIKDSIETYKNQNNISQLASLLNTLEKIGVAVDIGCLSEEQKHKLDLELKRLS